MLSKNQDIDIGQNKQIERKEHRRRNKNQRPSGSHIQESRTKVDWKLWYTCRGPEANPCRPVHIASVFVSSTCLLHVKLGDLVLFVSSTPLALILFLYTLL